MSNKELFEIEKSISDLRKAKHENADALTFKEEREFTDKIKELSSKLTSLVTAEAEKCRVCESSPHGIMQKTTLKNKAVTFFEIGCLNCKNRRAQGFTVESATEAWNAQDFLPAKEE